MADAKEDTVLENPVAGLLQNAEKPSYGTQDGKDDKGYVPPTAAQLQQQQLDFVRKEVDPNSQEAKQKPFIAARGNIQRVIDVTLLITNMANLARIVDNQKHYTDSQFGFLVAMLVISMICQITAGVCFYIVVARKEDAELHGKTNVIELQHKNWWDYLAVVMVGAVMLLNIIITSFDAIWSKKHEAYPGQNYMTLANGTVALVQPKPDGTWVIIPKA